MELNRFEEIIKNMVVERMEHTQWIYNGVLNTDNINENYEKYNDKKWDIFSDILYENPVIEALAINDRVLEETGIHEFINNSEFEKRFFFNLIEKNKCEPCGYDFEQYIKNQNIYTDISEILEYHRTKNTHTLISIWIEELEKWYYFYEKIGKLEKKFLNDLGYGYVEYTQVVNNQGQILYDDYNQDSVGKHYNSVYDGGFEKFNSDEIWEYISRW